MTPDASLPCSSLSALLLLNYCSSAHLSCCPPGWAAHVSHQGKPEKGSPLGGEDTWTDKILWAVLPGVFLFIYLYIYILHFS